MDDRNPVEEKGGHGHSLVREGERARESPRESRPLPGQAFIDFLSTLQGGWSSFTIHRFTVGDYLLKADNKGQNTANYFKEKDVTAQGGKWLNWLHSILGWFSTDFRKLKEVNICCLNSG